MILVHHWVTMGRSNSFYRITAGCMILAYLLMSALLSGRLWEGPAIAWALLNRETRTEHSIEVYHPSAQQSHEGSEISNGNVSDCNLPVPPSEAQILHLGIHDASALSTVTVGGAEQVTGVVQLVIEPGSAPLFIVATSYNSTIWHVSGATERISAFIHATDHWKDAATSGVVGLDSALVHSTPDRTCLKPFYDPQDDKGRQASAELAVLLGRPADTMIGVYQIAAIRLPGGEKEALTLPQLDPGFTGAAADVWQQGLRFNPDGLVTVAADEVVASLAVEPYDVWPQQFGLAQLLDQGKLTFAETNYGDPAEAAALQEAIKQQWSGKEMSVSEQEFIERLMNGEEVPLSGYRSDAAGALIVPGSYRIVGDMRFPAGLGGAHSATFVLARGVAMPDGSPGHSCVIVEERRSSIGIC